MMRKRIYLLVLFVFFLQDLFGQCAMCKAVATDVVEEEGNNINTGILYIMTVPYILIFLIAFLYRKKIIAFFKDLNGAGVSH
jgi:hypothetical protein